MIVVDLFCGVGGLSLGLQEAGFDVVAAYDFWDKAVETYNNNFNHPAFQFDLSDHEKAATLVAEYKPDVIVGGPPCFPAGTPILTKSGFKFIEDVSINDEVLTHRNRWRKVIATMVTENVPTVRMKGQGSANVETTAEHPFYACNFKSEDITWVDAKDMVGKYWATPTNIPHLDIPNFEVIGAERADLLPDFTKEFFEFVGRWVGDGWLRTGKRVGRTTNHGTVLLCGNKNEREVITALLYKTNLKFGVSEERTTTRFAIYSRPLSRWLEKEFGRGAKSKRIPVWLLSQSFSIKQAFMKGLMDADGYQRKGSLHRRLTTISLALTIGVRILGQSLGYSSAISAPYVAKKKRLIEGREVNENPFYFVSLFSNGRKGFRSGDNFWGRVRSVESTGQLKTVYNFEVEEDNSYIAHGFIVHNCQEFSSAGTRTEGAKANLTASFAKTVTAVKPTWFIMENVERATLSKAYQEARKIFKDAGYGLSENVLDASLCGIPQKRKRFFCIGKLDEADNFLDADIANGLSKTPMTIRDYFGSSLTFNDYYRHPRSYARRGVFSVDEPSPTIRGVNRPISESYVRHDGDTADPTTVKPMSFEDRAKVQTFPDNYKWSGTKTAKEQMIGNAVPVKLGAYVGNVIANYVPSSSSSSSSSMVAFST